MVILTGAWESLSLSLPPLPLSPLLSPSPFLSLLFSKNKLLQLRLATFLHKAFDVRNTVLSGHMLYSSVKLFIDQKLLDCVHQRN